MGSPITTHCLDTSTGKPAANLHILLERCVNDVDVNTATDVEYEWVTMGDAWTNSDGRAPEISAGLTIEPSIYRCVFFTQEYFSATGTSTFYPRVEVMFRITDTNSHYHIPLLLSPFGYSTYRGS
jgi:5-hydroxyisourate hydrolase